MPTRKQSTETKVFRQDAFASSSEYERGILGNLLAARCQRLTDREEIALMWWLQGISWAEGGLQAFAASFIESHLENFCPPSFRKLGVDRNRIYGPDEIKTIRAPFDNQGRHRLALRGERFLVDWEIFDSRSETEEEALRHPEAYSGRDLIEIFVPSTGELVDWIQNALVNPASVGLKTRLGYFSEIYSALQTLRSKRGAEAGGRLVQTAVTQQVFEELDYALESKSFVLIEGREGIGKSEAARAWAAMRPGLAVYVALECGSDETTLYRAIARQIGTSCTYARKAVEVRMRVQDALQPGQLMLVIDEAHFLWPQSERSERTAPKRLDWLRTALIDFGVPVALISTPQYFSRQCDRFRKCGWNANQIQRRLVRTASLPETLGEADAVAVAQSYFPGLSAREVRRVAGVALLSIGYLSTIGHLRKRVDFLARRNPDAGELELVGQAIQELGLKIDGRPLVDSEASKRAAQALQAIRTARAGAQETAPARSHRMNFQPPLVSSPA